MCRKSSGPVLLKDSVSVDVPGQQSLPKAEHPGQCVSTWIPAYCPSDTGNMFASPVTVICGKELWDFFCSSVCGKSYDWL